MRVVSRRGLVLHAARQGRNLKSGDVAEFVALVKKIGARIAGLDAAEHDQLCAWISHVPQMLSTALASTLVEEYGEKPRCWNPADELCAR